MGRMWTWLLMWICWQRLSQAGSRPSHLPWEERLSSLRKRVHSCQAVASNGTAKRGITFCAADHMTPDVYRTIYQLRHVWNTTLPLVVAHCAEISIENQEKIKSADPCTTVHDICVEHPPGQVFGMPIEAGKKRLRSFYCKVAALYDSKFIETMIVDMDVIWFKSPEVLFRYDGYVSTGALFFRDQIHVQDPSHPPGLDRPLPDVLRLFLKSKNVIVDDVSMAQKHITHFSRTYPFYWRSIVKSAPYLNDYQDSSVVVMNKQKHASTIAVMKEIISLGHLGYGDKELFWLSATISGIPYVFEPYLAAHYGDCVGLVLHYDPNDNSQPYSDNTITPLYLNAEHLIEIKNLEAVGAFKRRDMSRPIVVHPFTALNDTSHFKNKSTAWIDGSGCVCEIMGCIPVPQEMTHRILQMQWLTLSLYHQHTITGPVNLNPHHSHGHGEKEGRNNHSNSAHVSSMSSMMQYSNNLSTSTNEAKRACVPVAPFVSGLVHDMIENTFIKQSQCMFSGCPSVTHRVDLTLPWKSRDVYCDPMAFYSGSSPPPALREWAIHARTPNNPYNHVEIINGQFIKCGWEDELYLVVNQSLREILKDPFEILTEKKIQLVHARFYSKMPPPSTTSSSSTSTSISVTNKRTTTNPSPPPYMATVTPTRVISRRLCDRLRLGKPIPKDSSFFAILMDWYKKSRANLLFYLKNKMSPDLPMA